MEINVHYHSAIGLCDFDIIKAGNIANRYCYYADLVLDYANKDYGRITDVAIHDIESDLSSLDYDFIKQLIDKVFVSDDFPELSCIQKYFSFSSSFCADFTAGEKLKYRMGAYFSTPMPVTMKGRNWKPFDVSWVSDIREKQSKHESYESICKELTASKLDLSFTCQNISFESFSHAVLFFLSEMIEQNCKIQICPNCKKYFVPYFRTGTVFCDNPSPQERNKTCSEYRRYLNYLTKTQTDTATKLYKQIYNIKNNKMRRCKTADNPVGNPIVNADFEQFVSGAAEWKADIKAGIRTEDDYISWLREHKEKRGAENAT